MLCPICGNKLKDDVLFCSRCGSPQQPPKAAPAPVVEPPVYQPPTYEPPQPRYQQPPAYTPPTFTPAKKKKNLLWLWITLAILTVGVITILLLDFFGVIGLGIFGSRYAIAREVIEYDGDGNETSYTSIKTNEKGLPQKITRENQNGNYVLEIEYDEKGAITTHGTYDWTLSEWSFTIKYDQYGNIVRNTLKFPDGDKDVIEYDYTYDKKGNMLKKVTTVDDKETEKYTWEYDKEGNATFASYEDLSDETNNYTYYHDNTYKGGKMIKCATYDEDDQLLYVVHYEYEKDKLVCLEIEDAEGKLSSYTKYRYDDKGNLTKQITYDEADTQLTRYEYDYDKNGNCVYKEFYQMDQLVSATEYNFYSKTAKLSDAQVNIFSTLNLIPSPDQIVLVPSY